MFLKIFPSSKVRAITTDQEGGLWIGTSSSGLSYISLPQNDFQSFHLPLYRKDVSNPDRIVSLLADEEGDIWIGTQGNGLLIMDRKTKAVKKRFYPGAPGNQQIPGHTVWCMLPASPGSAWVGTRAEGLLLIDKEKGLIKNYNQENGPPEERLSENNVRSLSFINEKTICIGFDKKGVQILNIESGTLSFLPDTSWKKIFYGNTVLKTVSYHAPFLWMGTQGDGMIAYNMKDNKTYTITDKHGLPNNTIYAILPDNTGSLWMSTNKGICRFTIPDDLNKTNRSNFSLFTAEDGLQSNEFNTGAYHIASDGKLLFGGINGLNILDPVKLITQYQPIKVALTSASVNNEPLQEDSSITYKKSLKFPYDKNSLSFNFAALDFVSPGRLNYYYQLEGYDKTWVEAGNRNYAAYTNLPAGKYLFRVKSFLSTINNNDPVTTISITITPPFWKTWWFITLFVLLITGLLYALYRYRIDQLLRLQKIRNRIATDLHDDIGSTLTNISILSELSLKNMDEKEKAAVFLGRISEEVSHSSQALDDIVWSINTKNDTLEETVVRMRRYAAEIFDAANINYTLQLDEQFANRKLNMEQKRDCFLVFKETINNIYKHAEAKNVYIKLWLQHNSLFLEIKDDGKGFDTTASTHRNGIKNIHNRMEKWDGDVSVISNQGSGTEIKVRFPVE
jgi:two-component sensor histidine kinase/streptogramin lyase